LGGGSVFSNTAVGYEALISADPTSSGNTAVGFRALRNARYTDERKKLFLSFSSTPGCIVIGDTAGGVGYITLDNGVLTVSSTPPSACQ